jgi:hypothetical protein
MCALDRGKGGMPFVEVTHIRLGAERTDESPATDTETQLLLQPHLRAASIQLGRDSAVGWTIHRIVAVEKI